MKASSYAQRPAFTAYNLVRALASLDAHWSLLAILRVLGPLTTSELAGYAHRHCALNIYAVERALTRLRRATIIQGLDAGGRGAGTLFWALPGQTLPLNAERRVHTVPVLMERRSEERPTVGSWWLDCPRVGFTGAAVKRWDA